MRRARFFATVLAPLMALPALAFRPRPLSDLRFDIQSTNVRSQFTASDGSDFLVAGSVDGTFVAVQKVVRGNPAGSRIVLAPGDPQGVAWTGTHYLVAWSDARGLWVAELSREGSVLRMPVAPALDGGRWFSWNGRSGLALAYTSESRRFLAQRLDRNGQKSGAAVISDAGSSPNRLFAAAGGHVAIATTSTEILFFFFGDDGAQRTVRSVPGGFSTVVAVTDGEQTVAVYDRPKADVSELWDVVFSADGTIRRQPQTLGIAFRFLTPGGAVWDGSQSVIALTSSPNVKLLRISKQGDAAGSLIELEENAPSLSITGLASNSRELLLISSSGEGVLVSAMVPGAGRRMRTWRAASHQEGIAIAASSDGYLAAWAEIAAAAWVIRASRIDAAGNYLDGDGLVVGTMTNTRVSFPPMIAAASDGKDWLVVWGDHGTNATRVSSSGAVLDPSPLTIGDGDEFDVRWNGGKYVVVYTKAAYAAGSARGLFSVSVTREGSVSLPLLLAATPDETIPSGSISTQLYQPALAMIGGEGLVVFQRLRSTCRGQSGHHCFNGTEYERTIGGLRLDGNGGAVGEPFPIATGTHAGLHWLGSGGRVAVSSDGAQYLVLWSQASGVFGALIPKGWQQLGATPFQVAPDGYRPSLAFDGREYVAAWDTTAGDRLFAAHLSSTGAVQRTTALPSNDGEQATRPVVAANPAMPAMIAFAAPRNFEIITRSAILLESEFEPAAAPPTRPVLLGVARNDDDTVTVQWQPARNAIGVFIELQIADGSYRTIAVAPPGASSARVPLLQLNGIGVRLRTWNSFGDSDPSTTVLFSSRRRAAR